MKFTANAEHIVGMLTNAYLGRDIRTPLLDGPYGTRDIDKECGYPEAIGIVDYVRLYERGDIAARVVDIEPMECWKEYPTIYETEEERETPFEKAVDKLVSKTNLFSYLLRIDRISGIGRFGVLFLGFDDGREFNTPAPGFTDSKESEEVGKAKILYYRVFDESSVSISEYETDRKSPRYQLPKLYTLQFSNDPLIGDSTASTVTPATESVQVHWSRIIHIADNLTASELFGQPRMQNVYNRLLDLRKINGGAAEMFWKGGFPGYSFEVDPTAGEFSEEDKLALRSEAKDYSEGLRRYLTMVGVSVKSLAPQVADPKGHIDNVLRIIATTKGIPVQFFIGAESGNVSSIQNAKTWAERVAFRRHMYITPHIIRPTIDRLIQAGALPKPEDIPESDKGPAEEGDYTVKWIPLATLTETERAQVAKDLTEALARYSTSGSEALVPLPEFLGKFLGFSFQQVEAITLAPETERSVVFLQMQMDAQAGSTGSAGGNLPSSIPNMQKSKDSSKTPVNVQQKAKGVKAARKNTGSGTPPTATQG